ncbi:hypothetical protein ARMGADRAFT_1029705 [Armillaria gallica]|uniref:RING-type domain-containing protein n=1 Tax=Armillaria gallica TaxID=47427 RepID=A0A2H3DSJ5_ARMGA|nr:hypothetical protein ARMGADRAFT_1029705 [Armillaria gallica]
MSSLSGYDAVVVVAAQQHDSASPPAASKHVVDDAFQEWLHTLKALVADAPAYNIQLEFDSLQSRLIQCEALNQQLHRDLKHKQAMGMHTHHIMRTKLSQCQVHLRAQENYMATISNATIDHPATPFVPNVQASRFPMTLAQRIILTVSPGLIGTGRCSKVPSLSVKYVVGRNTFADQGWAHFVEEHGPATPSGLNNVGRYYGVDPIRSTDDGFFPVRLLWEESGRRAPFILRYIDILRPSMQVVILRQGNVLKGGFMLWQHINPFDLASTDTIEQLASNLTARRHDVNVPDVPAELGALMKEVRKWMRRQQRQFAAAREERLLATIRALTLTEDQDIGEKILKLLLQHRRRLDQTRREAEARLQRTREHTNRLWVALKPEWKSVQNEVTCPLCFRKLWRAIILVPCGHAVCTSCTYESFKKIKDIDENPHFMCMTCGAMVSCRPLRAHTVENIVKELPQKDDDERVCCEEAGKWCGYLGEESWNEIFS